jgi:hypothetical protein
MTHQSFGKIVQAGVLCLFLLAAPATFATESMDPPLYGSWLVREIRASDDHWLTRTTYVFGNDQDGAPEIRAYATCRTEAAVFTIHVRSPVKIDAHSFTILFSEDELSVPYGSVCAAVLHEGTYHYQMSGHGDSVLVGEGQNIVRWRRHELP